MKKLFNIYKNNKGQLVPKAPIINISREVEEWIKINKQILKFSPADFIDKNWFFIGLGVSLIGNIYPFYKTCSDSYFKDYILNNDKFIIFEDIESFEKYLNWALHIPKHIVNNYYKLNKKK